MTRGGILIKSLFLIQLFLSATLTNAQTPPVQKIGPNLWKVSPDAFSYEGQDAETLLGQDVVEPAFLTGETEEIQMTKIHKGSLLDQAGFRSGDRIIGINGHALDGAWSVLDLLQELKNSDTQITVQILRNGKRIVHSYIFEGDSLQDLAGIFIEELTAYLNPFA